MVVKRVDAWIDERISSQTNLLQKKAERHLHEALLFTEAGSPRNGG